MMRIRTLQAAGAAFGVMAALLIGSAHAQQSQQRQQPAPAKPPAQTQTTAPQPLPPKGTAVVVLDNLAVEREAKAFQSIRTQHDKQLGAQQGDISKLENELRNADQELAKQRTVLSPEAFNEKRRDLERRFTEAQQSVQGRRRDIDQAAGEAYNKVVQAMLEVVASLAQDNDYKVVLSRSQVIVSERALDITGEVIQRLDKKMPTITVASPPPPKR